MFPTTISDGIANDSNSSVQFQYFNNQLLLVYANENRVIIKSWEGETIQIIPLRLEIRSLAFSDRNGQLAVTQDSEVYIFKFESMEEKKFHWNLVTKIHYFNQIIQVSWFNNDHLLIGSDSVSLYKKEKDEFICYWNENCSSNIFIADISSDGQWLALTHNNDRVVKIWNIKSNRQYYYLKHPRTVLSLSWYQHNNNGDNVPILFTTCYDEIFRCWTFNNNCFYLSTTLDPSQWSINNKNNNCSNTASEIINKNVINKDLTKDHQLITNNQLNLIPSFHWINPIIIKELAYLEINRIKNQQSEIIGEVELNYLIQIYNLTPLLIFKFEQDGSLIIWKLEGLENIINSAPKIKVLSKISKIIHFNQNQSLLFKKWFININPLSLKFKDQNYAGEFIILNHNSNNQLQYLSIGLLNILFNQTNNSIKMGYLINGCSQKINKIINNYNNNQLWSLNNKNEICSWEFKIQENINNNNFFVKNYKFDFNLIDFEWANENYLILLETKNCYLYNISYNELIVLNQHEGHSFQSLIVKNLTDELILIIIVLDNYELISYKVKIEDNKIQSIESIKMEKLPNLIDEKKLKNYYLLSNLYYLNQETECNEYSISLVYYNEMENKLEIYYNYLTNSNYKWYKQNEVKVNLENIKKIEFSNFGLVFIVGTNEKKQTIIKIMDIKFNSFNFIKQWEFNWNNESIKNIQFLVTLFYYPMIIIITEFKIYILNFYKYKFIISNILYLPVNLYTNIDWFKILNDGTLYIKIEEQIYMFGKWIAINEIERDDETKLSKSIYSNNIINTIHTLSADYQNLLLNYHPNYLLEYIEWGEYDLMNKIIIHIEKYQSEQNLYLEDSILLLPPLPLIEFYNKKEDENKNKMDNLITDDLFSTSKNKQTLSKYQFEEMILNLKKYQLNYMNEEDKLKLIMILECFDYIIKYQTSIDDMGKLYLFHILLNLKCNRIVIESDYILNVFYSQSKDLILNEIKMLIMNHNIEFNWDSFKNFGLPFWIQEDEILKKEIEIIARNQYLINKDPIECSLFYLLLNKKKLLLSLWKTATYHKDHSVMVKFLNNDFTQQRWKLAAQKNAFKLIGLQRYEYAIAFFLLANKIEDAIGVSLRYLKDPILAFVLCRCYYGINSEYTQTFIKQKLIPNFINNKDLSMINLLCYYLNLKEISLSCFYESIKVTINKLKDNGCDINIIQENIIDNNEEDIVNFNLYIKIKSKFIKEKQIIKEKIEDQKVQENEKKIVLKKMNQFMEIGMPIMSLLIYNQWNIEDEDLLEKEKKTDEKEKVKEEKEEIDWSWSIHSKNKKSYDSVNSAINSGIVDFDDWGWNTPNNNNNNNKSTDIFANEDIFNNKINNTVDNEDNYKLKLNKIQKERYYQSYHQLMLILCHEIIQCVIIIYKNNRENLISKRRMIEYLDTIKVGIKKISENNNQFRVDQQLLKISNQMEISLVAFYLLYEGLLNNDGNNQNINEHITQLMINEINLIYCIIFNNNGKSYYESKLMLQKIEIYIQKLELWGLILMLKQNNLSLINLLILKLIIIYIMELIKIRDYNKIYYLFDKVINNKITITEHNGEWQMKDIDEIKLMINIICNGFELKNEFEIENRLSNLDFDLKLELGDDLKLINSTNDNFTSDMNFNCQSKEKEKEIQVKILYFLIKNIEKEVNFMNNNSGIGTTLLDWEHLLSPLYELKFQLETGKQTVFDMNSSDKLNEINTYDLINGFQKVWKWLEREE